MCIVVRDNSVSVLRLHKLAVVPSPLPLALSAVEMVEHLKNIEGVQRSDQFFSMILTLYLYRYEILNLQQLLVWEIMGLSCLKIRLLPLSQRLSMVSSSCGGSF
jgi:hypothetical protein